MTVSRAFDEALAFYFACWIFRNSRWAEFAYGAWASVRELTNPPEPFSALDANSDPAGQDYGWGMWWTRILWQMSQDPTLVASFNRVLLKSLQAMAGKTPEINLNADTREQIRSVFTFLGANLYATANNSDEQAVIQGMLQSCEIQVP